MQFYKIECFTKEAFDDEETGSFRRNNERGVGRQLLPKCERFADAIDEYGYAFLCNANKCEFKLGLIVRDEMDVDRYIARFLKKEKIDVEQYDIKEITLNELSRMLGNSERDGYIFDEDDVLREFNLDGLVGGRRFRPLPFDEKLIREKKKEKIYSSANRFFTKGTLVPELDRIFISENMRKIIGHPVDYIIESDDEDTIDGTVLLLLQALYDVGRIINHRFCEIELFPEYDFSKKTFSNLYGSCVGGAVVLKIEGEQDEDSDEAHGNLAYLEDMCEVVKRHCTDVLTVFCLPKANKNLRSSLFENLGNITFIEIQEEVAQDKEAIDYLKELARKNKVRADKKLTSKVVEGQGYLTPELNDLFGEWYATKLKTQVYSQYKDFEGVKKKVKSLKPKGSAYEELESMIGIESAKKMIHQALDCYKARKLFKDKGMTEDDCCYHMIFTGNPGTAKTTVARLFARIMKDNGVLERGHIVETGRAGLVGRYVGWTAPQIRAKFDKARGGVLFIDEAYSLVDDRDGSYGDEAINTIVQEMENHRDDVVVIFAGYPDKMEGFLDKNPGLRSRIAHYIRFEDYNADELCQIAEHIATQKGLVLDEGALDRIHEIVETATDQADFGNGRYVRNLIEKARIVQNSRLVRMDYDDVTADDIKRILAEDVEFPEEVGKKPERQFGFIAS